MSGDLQATRYACKCLNVRIRSAPAPSTPLDVLEDPDFFPVFTGEDGITVEHTQVTVRTRTSGKLVAGTSRFFRYTTITCLLCHFIVYRIYQTYPADVDGKEGPLLPTEDWVERDVMKSFNGWIQVHKDSLTGPAIDAVLSSPNYSATFSVLLPEMLTPSASLEPIFERPASQSSIHLPASPSPPQFFSNLRPLFLPPPFTPSHPVFAYLASVAANEAQAARDAAEDYMNEQLKAKIAEIESADAILRKKVESLWEKFKDGVNLIQQGRESVKSKERAMNGSDSSASRIRDFTPAAVSPVFCPSSVPRVSALSASLATSSFHHPSKSPKRSSSSSSSPPHGRSASLPSSNSTDFLSNTSTLVAPRHRSPEGTNVLKYRRNLHDTVDYATSYKYFVDLEKDMLRMREASTETVLEQDQQTHHKGGPGDSTVRAKSENNRTPTSRSPQQAAESVDDSPPQRGREKTKAKRKVVTFDVQPAVVTIETGGGGNEEGEAQDQRPEMLFEFEENTDGDSQQSLSFSRQALQTNEQPVPATRPRRQRQSRSNLSSSFSGLRPASLPAPSNIRPPRSPHGSDFSVPSIMPNLPRPFLKEKGRQLASPEASPSRLRTGVVIDRGYTQGSPVKSPQTSSPSQSGSWKAESKAWQTYTRRQRGSRDMNGKIPEERENEDESSSVAVPVQGRDFSKEKDSMFVGSLPIPIQLRKPPPALSLASYQPRTLGASGTDMKDCEPERPGQNLASSSAIRKAKYAERDLRRSIDPGLLDFSNVAEDEANGDDSQSDDADAGGRGRKRALEILQSQSEIPEAGMWRSLAS